MAKYDGMSDLLSLERLHVLKVAKVDKLLKSSSRQFHNLKDDCTQDFCEMLVLL